MSRSLVFLVALSLAAPATAAIYAGRPVAPGNEAKLVGRDIVWNLAGDTYRGSTAESRPVVLCQSLAKRAGRLESFTVDGKALADSDLAKCNAVAPAAAASSLAEAN